jgi:DNA-binding protein
MSENDAASNAGEVSSAEAKPDTSRSAPQPRAPSNHIYVGNKKPVMSYAMSTLLQLGQSEEVILKARGMAISNTVDVAEIVSKRLGNNAFEVKNIKIDTEMVGQGDDQRNVSTIEIVLGKK